MWLLKLTCHFLLIVSKGLVKFTCMKLRKLCEAVQPVLDEKPIEACEVISHWLVMYVLSLVIQAFVDTGEELHTVLPEWDIHWTCEVLEQMAKRLEPICQHVHPCKFMAFNGIHMVFDESCTFQTHHPQSSIIRHKVILQQWVRIALVLALKTVSNMMKVIQEGC